VRRLCAVLTSALLLHVTLAAGDFACAGYATHAHHPPGQPSHAHHDGGSSTPRPTSSCDTPVRADCCTAMLSCAVALLSAGAPAPAAVLGGALPLARGVTAALSIVRAPEPPPPKA